MGHKNTRTKKKRRSSHHHTLQPKTRKGVALKLWLHRNHCYLDALYRELIKKGADSPKRIQSLSKAQLDAIVRKVRVERFGQFKDQTACTRFVAGYDQLLSK